MRPNHAAPVLGLIVLSLLVLLDSPVSHSDTSSTSSIVSIHLVGQVSAWNESQPSGPNPKITVNQGDTVSIILTSVDTMHEFIVDWDKDGASFLGSCARGDNCSSVFSLGTGTTITFTVSFPAGTYTYFCAFHATMIGSLEVRAVNPKPLTITGISPNPTLTGTPVTLTYAIANPTTLLGISIDWGDGTNTHPSTTARSDSHSYITTGGLQSQTFTINVTATNSTGQAFATISETVNDRAATLVISNLSPNPANIGETVRISFSTSDPDGTVQSTQVDWGDNSASNTLSATATSDTHSYASAGAFKITITASDDSGLLNYQTVAETILDLPPVLTINQPSPTAAYTGQTVTISFQASDPDGTISSITVNWGDGSSPDVLPASATSDSRSYKQAGLFTITISANDNSGSSSHVSTSPLPITATPSPTNETPTILGLAAVEFYSVIGVITAIIAALTLLAFKIPRHKTAL